MDISSSAAAYTLFSVLQFAFELLNVEKGSKRGQKGVSL